MQMAVHHAAMATADGSKVYVFGGRTTNGDALTYGFQGVQVFDAATGVSD